MNRCKKMGIEKIIFGLILVIVGLWLIIPVSWCQAIGFSADFCPHLWVNLWSIVEGIVPALIVFIGAILVWIEIEELKLERPKRKR
jgi:hypothetical protein